MGQRTGFWAAIALIGLNAGAAAQERAGEAVRVQQATTQVIASASDTVSTGDAVYRNARIATREYGSVEMRFLDDTLLTLGPNSDVVLDDYVYNPDIGAGQSAISLGVGVLRVISGRIPSENVSVRTPVASIGIRGTDFLLDSTTSRLLRVWVDEGSIAVTPNESGLEFIFDAPSYGECTLNFCRIVPARDRPETFPRRTDIFGLPIGDPDPSGKTGERDPGGDQGGDSNDGGGDSSASGNQ